MATVGLLGSLLLVITGAVVMSGHAPTEYSAENGVLRDYTSAPSVAWTVDDSALPGYEGSDPLAVAGVSGDDWLLSYPSGIGRSYLLVDGQSGEPGWPAPIRAGLGDCAITEEQTVGCAVKLGDLADGFYVVDDEGRPRRTGDLDDTGTVTAVGNDFLRVNQLGYQASLRTADGTIRWRRSFAGTPKPRMVDGLLVVDTTDGRAFVLDPATGGSVLDCADCTLRVYPQGVLAVISTPGKESVAVYPRSTTGSVARVPIRTAPSMGVVNSPSTLPVLAGVGAGQVMESSGRYEVIDPRTGAGLWQIADPELSKNTLPCGSLVAMAKKDRSRIFYTLDDGVALGKLAPPDVTVPSRNLDHLRCVGTSGTTAVFAAPDKLTAYDAETGAVAWDRDVNGAATTVDGYIVLIEGTELTVLNPG